MFDEARKSLTKAVNRVAYGAPPTSAPSTLAEIPLTSLAGGPVPEGTLTDKVVLFVNVASRCGLTPQYAGLVELRSRFADRGFEIVGTPCNQFLGQEPGRPDEIAAFCSTTYGVDFPLLAKAHVNGAERTPLYRWLIGSEAGGGDDIQWNFEKFLVNRQGEVVGRFAPRVEPDAEELHTAIEAALASES